jgi:PilZ domain
MEKRYFKRVDYAGDVFIKYMDQQINGNVQNICLQGLFVSTEQRIPLDTVIHVSVPSFQNSHFNLNAKVVRCEKNGVGLQIKKMDVDSFVQLRNVVATKCNDHGRIMRETYKVTNCIT